MELPGGWVKYREHIGANNNNQGLLPPEEEAIASKACGMNICIVSLFVQMPKATENDSNREANNNNLRQISDYLE